MMVLAENSSLWTLKKEREKSVSFLLTVSLRRWHLDVLDKEQLKKDRTWGLKKIFKEAEVIIIKQ